MPNWLQTALIVLAVLVVLYLLLVAAQLVVVTILRRQYAPTRMQIETAQRDVSNARKRLDQLAPFIASGSREMPLGPLYDQARDLIAKATHSAGEALRQVNALIEERIAEEPAVAALRLVPMTREIMRRLGMRQGARTAAVQLRAFSDSMSRVNQLQADIAAMPKREKDALTQTRQRAQTLTAMLDAEVRPKQPLLDGRETLRQATTNLTQAERLLSAESPTEAAVVAAYPLRLASEEQLSALDDVLAEMKRKRTQAEAALAKLDEQLQTHKNEISTEASGGLPRPMFIARATESDAHITALQTKIDAGEYEAAAALAMDAQMHLAAQSAALAAVRAERARIIGMADKAQRHLVTIGQWIGETSAQFVLDRTTAAHRKPPV